MEKYSKIEKYFKIRKILLDSGISVEDTEKIVALEKECEEYCRKNRNDKMFCNAAIRHKNKECYKIMSNYNYNYRMEVYVKC